MFPRRASRTRGQTRERKLSKMEIKAYTTSRVIGSLLGTCLNDSHSLEISDSLGPLPGDNNGVILDCESFGYPEILKFTQSLEEGTKIMVLVDTATLDEALKLKEEFGAYYVILPFDCKEMSDRVDEVFG